MPAPHGFSWIEKPLLGALAFPDDPEDLEWLRNEGVQLLISLSEDPPRKIWVDDAGLLLIHLPVRDMTPPTQEDLERCITSIDRAHDKQMGVAVHCGAGLGRTGVVLACYFIHKGLNASNAIARVRRLRPGSIETEEQEEAVHEFARSHRPDKSS